MHTIVLWLPVFFVTLDKLLHWISMTLIPQECFFFRFTSTICRMCFLKVCGILYSHVKAFIAILLRVHFIFVFVKTLRNIYHTRIHYLLFFYQSKSYVWLIPNTSPDHKHFPLRYTRIFTDAIASGSKEFHMNIWCTYLKTKCEMKFKNYFMRFYFFWSVCCFIFMNKLIEF